MAHKTLKEIKEIAKQVVLDRFDGETDSDGKNIVLRNFLILKLQRYDPRENKQEPQELWEVVMCCANTSSGIGKKIFIAKLNPEGELIVLREEDKERE